MRRVGLQYAASGRYRRQQPTAGQATHGFTMTVTIKTAEELEKMRVAGRLAAQVLEMIEPHVQPGVSTGELDRICHDYIVEELDAVPTPPDAQRLVTITQECLYRGIEVVRPGATLGDIGHVIQEHAERNYYSVVREYCGHGIGRVFHEEPQVLHYGRKGAGLRLEEGMTFTIEPMLNAGRRHVKLNKKDGWTVSTRDGRLSAQWEHTLAVTSDGCEVLTARSYESF